MKSKILMKIGGRAFKGKAGFEHLAEAINIHPGVETIIVHGGGAEISRALAEAGRETRFIDGVRVTRLEDIKIIETVLSQTINRRIAQALEDHGVLCRRMAGRTGGLFAAEPLRREGRDYGYTGTIKKVDPGPVLAALARGRMPVVSPISGDEAGGSYNVNADSAAAALAVATACTDLVYFTDVPGVMVNDTVLPDLTIDRARALIADGTIQAGMVAKMNSVFTALEGGVGHVHIAQWRGPETLEAIIKAEGVPGTTVRL